MFQISVSGKEYAHFITSVQKLLVIVCPGVDCIGFEVASSTTLTTFSDEEYL